MPAAAIAIISLIGAICSFLVGYYGYPQPPRPQPTPIAIVATATPTPAPPAPQAYSVPPAPYIK